MQRPMVPMATVAAVMVITAACSGGDGTTGTAATSTTVAPTPTEAVTTEAAPRLEIQELAGFGERSVVFSNVEFTVTGVRISNERPDSYAAGGEPEVDPSTRYAYLDVVATNGMTSSLAEGLDAADYRLILGGEEVAPVEEMSYLSEVTGIITAASAVETFLAFEMPADADLSGAVLRIGAPPDRPAVLPLTGEVPTPDYPSTFPLDGAAEGVGPTNGGTIEFRLIEATLSEDRPHEHSNSPTGLRADSGELFLVLHVQAEKVSGRGNDLLGIDAFRLVVDGIPRAPWDVAIDPLGSNETPTAMPNAVVDAWVAFLVPVDAAEFALRVGDLSNEPGSMPVELPPMT